MASFELLMDRTSKHLSLLFSTVFIKRHMLVLNLDLDQRLMVTLLNFILSFPDGFLRAFIEVVGRLLGFLPSPESVFRIVRLIGVLSISRFSITVLSNDILGLVYSFWCLMFGLRFDNRGVKG